MINILFLLLYSTLLKSIKTLTLCFKVSSPILCPNCRKCQVTRWSLFLKMACLWMVAEWEAVLYNLSVLSLCRWLSSFPLAVFRAALSAGDSEPGVRKMLLLHRSHTFGSGLWACVCVCLCVWGRGRERDQSGRWSEKSLSKSSFTVSLWRSYLTHIRLPLSDPV